MVLCYLSLSYPPFNPCVHRQVFDSSRRLYLCFLSSALLPITRVTFYSVPSYNARSLSRSRAPSLPPLHHRSLPSLSHDHHFNRLRSCVHDARVRDVRVIFVFSRVRFWRFGVLHTRHGLRPFEAKNH